MRGLLKTIVTTYVLIKVTPKIIKGVVYVAGGAITGITDKIVKAIFVIIDGEKIPRRNLRKDGYYSSHGFNSYTDYRTSCKNKA